MTPAEFLKALRENPTAHYYAVTPDAEGLILLLPRILKMLAHDRDVRILDGMEISVAGARALAREASMVPLAGSERTHFLIRRADRLDPGAAAALLLAVEESRRGRFVFLAQRFPRAHYLPLASRCRVARLPFLSRRAVLGNLQALHLDARTADEKDLWDGTLGGTLASVREGDERTGILNALNQGLAGLPDLLAFTDSPTFDRVLLEHLTTQEREFLGREPSKGRRALVAYTLLSRRTA